jgi:hypothetical protein
VKAVLGGGIAGFDAAVREANSSPAGRRNGGAMLLALASEKALLTTLVRLAPAEHASDAARLPYTPAKLKRSMTLLDANWPGAQQEFMLESISVAC